MSIIDQLSSQVGDRSEAANLKVGAQCLKQPALLADIAAGLQSSDDKLVGDCAQVMTMVASEKPELVAPYAEEFSKLLNHKKSLARWEGAFVLAHIAGIKPLVIEKNLAKLDELIRKDSSVIVRDYSVRAVSSYAGTGKKAAKIAYPVLITATEVFDSRHSHLAMPGLAEIARLIPSRRKEITGIGESFIDHKRGMIKKAAKKLLKMVDGL